MSPWIHSPLLGLALAAWAAGGGQESRSEAAETTLCEVLKEPGRFDGQMVRLRVEVLLGRHAVSFHDSACGEGILWAVGDTRAESSRAGGEYAAVSQWETQQFFPEQFEWRPVRLVEPVALKRDTSYRDLASALDRLFNGADEDCSYCPNAEVFVTVTGRFDYVETHDRVVRDAPGWPIRRIRVGFGPMQTGLRQLVVREFSDVLVEPLAAPAAGTRPLARPAAGPAAAGLGEQTVRLSSGTLTLPAGYTHVPGQGVDSWIGSFLPAAGRLAIRYDIGPLASGFARAQGAGEFREERVNGTTMLTEVRGTLPNRVFITFPTYGPTNFIAVVRNRAELEAFRRIAMSFRPY